MGRPSITTISLCLAFAMVLTSALPAWANDGKRGDPAQKARVEMVAGIQALSDGDFDISVALLTRAVSSGKLSREHLSDSYYFLGRALIRLNEGLLALQQFKRSVRTNPENVKALRLLCRALSERGKVLDAQAHCDKAVELDPEDWRGYFARAQLNEFAGNRDDAFDDFQRAYDLAPEQARTNEFVIETLQNAGVLKRPEPSEPDETFDFEPPD